MAACFVCKAPIGATEYSMSVTLQAKNGEAVESELPVVQACADCGPWVAIGFSDVERALAQKIKNNKASSS